MTKPRRTLSARLEALGHWFFYVALRVFGQRGGYLLLYPVIGTYLLFGRGIHRQTRPYLRRRFPGHGAWARWVDTMKIVLSFGRVLVDRGWLGMCRGVGLDGELIGARELLDLIGEGKGVVLLTAHVGNWQTALSRINDLSVPINSLMHYEEEAVAKHYFDLRNEPVPFRIIKSDGFMGGLVEATVALQRGEVVTIMGDRYTGGPAVEADFLGDPVRFPAAAYSLASATGAPVAILLAAKTGRRRYRLEVRAIFRPEGGDRDRRREEMNRGVRCFARVLEEYVGEYPQQWYNFFDFWHR
ncbi:MAG: lysophospholipid acyltransferase family protein [Proteobacteria bacterium]|nr:lysophospholipid acyltransferase family protein [Pseudomonadota bacterium]MBU1685853.1 lysophospholipid acyltransferase family protein [Pseudomonadota bacterium]